MGDVCGPADARWVRRWVRRAGVEAVLVDTVFRAPVLAGLNSVLLAHDVFHERAAQLAAAGLEVRPAGFTAAAEAALAGQVRHIAAIQPADADMLARLCPAANVFAAPMPALPCPPPAGRAAGAKLVFLGSATPANVAGLRWFFAEIWPRLAGVTLDIVGDAGLALGTLPERVTARGRVADLAPALHGADVALAPLPYGSGLKLKLLDYARHGLTTIATPAALAGLAPGGPFIEAATPAAFAAAITAVLAAPRPPAAALGYIEAHYTPDACFAPLAAALGLP
jgi:succinoglycan biosynthesis protein ExoO